jgi:branched-chain amino acid transport system permease protein
VSAFFALVIGALSLRTRGVYFIMITLAFAQMAYYIVAGLARYGGDDGLTIQKRSQFVAPINLSNKVQFYYICLALLCAAIYLVWRLVNSRFGMTIQGARSNDTRMRAIGFPTYRYKLICFVIAGTLCGLAGALLANHTDFVSPAMMYWTRSGDLIIMVVLHLRPIVRCSGVARAGGGALGHHRVLADHPWSAAVVGRPIRAGRYRRSARQGAPWLNCCG